MEVHVHKEKFLLNSNFFIFNHILSFFCKNTLICDPKIWKFTESWCENKQITSTYYRWHLSWLHRSEQTNSRPSYRATKKFSLSPTSSVYLPKQSSISTKGSKTGAGNLCGTTRSAFSFIPRVSDNHLESCRPEKYLPILKEMERI